MFNTNWDVDKYKAGYEPEEHWNLRRKFMVAHKDRYPEDKLVCLTQVFFNMEFLGCKYPEKTMELVNELAEAVAEDFRESRKSKLKRTFVGAQDAAGAKAKGGKPPPGVTEGARNEQQQSSDQRPPYKKSRFDSGQSGQRDYGGYDSSGRGSRQEFQGGRNEQQQSRDQSSSYNRSRSDDNGPRGQGYSDRGSGPPNRKEFQGGWRNEPQQSRDQPASYNKSRFDNNGSRNQQSSDRYDSNSRGSGPYSKAPYNKEHQDIPADFKELFKDFVLMIPTRGNSKTEEDPLKILHQNFVDGMISFQMTGTKKSECYSCELLASPVPLKGQKPHYQIASVTGSTQKECKVQAAINAIEKLKRACTVIEPNPAWFQEGGTPEFISRRIPCSKTPRSYLIMTKKDTGHITPQVADMLMDNLKRSSNEDMFFIDTEYSEKEKRYLLDRCQAHQLGNRHFGSGVQLSEHHVCIYKRRTAQEIMAEASTLGWKHPKWLIRVKNSVN